MQLKAPAVSVRSVRWGWPMYAITALSGAATMVVELAAVRLLAPWFGASMVVWTNVIAVILLALALGYLWGARLAARALPSSALAWLLLAAGCWVAWLPSSGSALARWMLPAQLGLHEAAELIGWGSLAVSLVTFLPPALLLGAVSPLVVECLARVRGDSAGRAGGLVLCISTLGSLAGVFSTSHLLLPVLGLHKTFWLAGAVLLGAGAWVKWFERSRSRADLPLLALACGALLAPERRPALPEGSIELAQRESEYQSLRVVEERAGNPLLRILQVNEGYDSFQSVWQESGGLLPDGFYYNDFLLPLVWSDPPSPWRVLVLGLGAGTVWRVFQGVRSTEPRFIGVELDPAVIELGRQFFGLETDPGREVWSGLDARVALRIARGPFEQIVLDCYANQVEIPAHLCTIEFFQDLRQRLTEGGWLTANLGGFDFDDPVVATVARTCARSFAAPVLLVRVPQSRNFMLLARRDAGLPWVDGQLRGALTNAPLHLGARQLPGFSRVIHPEEPGLILSDDRCPVEELQLRSMREARARRQRGGDV